MRLRQIITLLYASIPIRRIAAETGSSSKSIITVKKALPKLDPPWVEGDSRTDEELKEALFRKTTTAHGKALPEKQVLHRTKKEAWEEYCKLHPNNAMSYASFCRMTQVVKPTNDAPVKSNDDVRRVSKPGHMVLAWHRLKITYANKSRPLHILLAYMPVSGRLELYGSLTCTVKDLVTGLNTILQTIGGVPASIYLHGNAVSGNRHSIQNGHDVYKELLNYYKIREAAYEENAVLDVLDEILSEFPTKRFTATDVDSEVEALLQEAKRAVDQYYIKDDVTNISERAYIRSLPRRMFCMIERKTAKVSKDYHISIGGSYYSVPCDYYGYRVDVEITSSTIEILFDGVLLAKHPKCHIKGRYTTDPAHLPDEKGLSGWSGDYFIERARRYGGESAVEVISRILTARPYEEQGYRACNAILANARDYSPAILELACELALSTNARLTTKSILHIMSEMINES